MMKTRLVAIVSAILVLCSGNVANASSFHNPYSPYTVVIDDASTAFNQIAYFNGGETYLQEPALTWMRYSLLPTIGVEALRRIFARVLCNIRDKGIPDCKFRYHPD